MKKTTLKLLALMLACLMLLPFALACDKDNGDDEPKEPTEAEKFDAMTESEKAFYILNYTSDNSNTARADITMNLSYVSDDGYQIITKADMINVSVDTSDTYLDYTETVISLSMAGQSVVSTVKNGWVNGKHFEYAEQNGIGQGVYVEETKEIYLSQKEDDNGVVDSFGLKNGNCNTVTCVKDAQGNWTATFSGINGDGLAEFKKLIEPLLNADLLVGATLTLTASSDFKPIKASVDMEFEGENEPEFSFECVYSFGESVTIPSINTTTYTKVDSLD